MDWTLAIHGGAGRMTRDTISAEADAAVRTGLAAALEAGAAVLAGGGAALDAVEAAVRVLEDDPAFNAGRGAALTRDGTAELDAAVMHGGGAGAVAGVAGVRHPVSLARAVMDRTPHVLLAGPGTDAFATDMLARDVDGFDVDMKYGTVGAVARDGAGRLAAATSTGGVTGKRPGRVGDSPLIGAGTFAADDGAAVSCTGAGEFFIRVAAAAQVSARVRLMGQLLDEAVDAVLAEIAALGGTGGMIAIGRAGAPVWRFTTPGMNRAMADSAGHRAIAIYDDDTGQGGPVG